uniref:OAR domain-containing protein n=1 Tax=Heterorhabditis bacteriophora TaxID=37862 RepID=A0A1I7X2B2_HETBA
MGRCQGLCEIALALAQPPAHRSSASNSSRETAKGFRQMIPTSTMNGGNFSMPYIPSVSSAAAANMSSVANMTAAYFTTKNTAYGAPHLGFSAAPTHNFLPTGMGYIGSSLADCQPAGIAWNAGAPPSEFHGSEKNIITEENNVGNKSTGDFGTQFHQDSLSRYLHEGGDGIKDPVTRESRTGQINVQKMHVRT